MAGGCLLTGDLRPGMGRRRPAPVGPAGRSGLPPPWRCLFTGHLEPDMAVVAPYLVELEHSSAFTRRLLAEGWGQNWGVFLTSQLALPALWRHVRQQVHVYGPKMEPLFFRFYDPRVMRNYLPTCSPKQLGEFFGPVDFYIAEAEEPARAHAWSVSGKLI